MIIVVNGKTYTCQKGITLQEFLVQHSFSTQQTAVAVNGEVIKASNRATFQLKD